MPSMRSPTAPAPSSTSPVPVSATARPAERTPASASTSTGRSAPRSAPTATSTATCAPAASTRRASCAPILRELRHWARAGAGPRTVTSIFFGGGTPSLMRPATVGAILDAHRARCGASTPTPRSRWRPTRRASRPARFRGYRAAGVNRVSLGVQSLDDADLRALGRLHTVDGGAGGDRRRARDVRALLLRPDLRAARPDAAGLAGRARARRWRSPAGICRSTSSPSSRRRRSRRCMRAASSSCPTATRRTTSTS